MDNKVHNAVYVDSKGDVFLEVTYEEQSIFIPIELAKKFSEDLAEWVKKLMDIGYESSRSS